MVTSLRAARLDLRSLEPSELRAESARSREPFVLTPARGQEVGLTELESYLSENGAAISDAVREQGALLMRGFPVDGPDAFERALRTLGYDLYEKNTGGASPRGKITKATYASTDAPGQFVIGFHTEFAYQCVRPSMISFFCDLAPTRFGETPIFDCAAVLDGLSAGLRAKLRSKRIRYTRFFSGRKRSIVNFRKRWEDVYFTSERRDVEQTLERDGIAFEWDRHGNLRTEHIAPATVIDPATGRECLNVAIFNGDTFAYNLERFPERTSLCKRRLVQWLMRREARKHDTFLHTTFGDGSELAREESEEIQRSAWDNSILFAWQRGDVLILNNIRYGHARMTVAGPRRIVTAMGSSYDLRDLPYRSSPR